MDFIFVDMRLVDDTINEGCSRFFYARPSGKKYEYIFCVNANPTPLHYAGHRIGTGLVKISGKQAHAFHSHGISYVCKNR
jgi:hypothetical protein